MEKARILHCEQDEVWQQNLARALGRAANHKVTSVLSSYDQLRTIAEDLAGGKIDANVVVMNSQLSGGSIINHPKLLVSELSVKGPRLPVIGLSERGLALRGLQLGKDLSGDILKEEFIADPDILVNMLDRLTDPQGSTA